MALNATGALRFGAARALNILLLAAHMVLRVLAGLVPFVLAAGLTYMALLRDFDINYYLARRPPQFCGSPPGSWRCLPSASRY